MPYISQDEKKTIHNELKPILAYYKVKASIGIEHYSTLRLNIYSSPIDFLGNYNKVAGGRYADDRFQPVTQNMDVNHFWYKEHFDGIALEFLSKIIPIMNQNNGVEVEDSDYGTVPHYYLDINIGQWNKPYQLIGDAK